MANVASTAAIDEPKRAKSDREEPPEPEVKVKKSKLPTPRSFTLIPTDFYAYVADLSAQDWAHVAMYVYRLANPRIVRDPSNVDSIDREPPSIPFTEQYLKDTQGSGKFEVKLNDTDARATVCRMITDINDPDYPPKFDIRELDVGFKGNRLIVEKLKREGKLTQDGEVVQKSENGDATMAQALKDIAMEAMRGRKEQPGNIENQAMGKMLDMMSSASAKSIEIALGQVKREDPASFIALLTTAKELFTPPKVEAAPAVNPLDILAKAKEIFAPAKSDNGGDPMMKLLLSQLDQAQKDASAERQRNHELQLKMLEARANQSDPLEMVQKVLTLQEKLGGGETRNWKEKLVDQGMEHVPELLALGKQALTRYQQQPRPANPQQQPRPQQPQPGTQQQPNPENAQQQQQTAQPGADTNNMPEPPSDPEIAFLLPIMLAHGHNFVTAFKNDPVNGGPALADSLILFGGLGTYERIARMGQAKIIETIKLTGTDGQMYKDLLAVGTPEMLADFIQGFIDGPEDPDDPDDGDFDPPAEAKRAPRKKKEPAAA